MPIYRPGQGVPLARVTEERQPTIILSIPASPPAAGISTIPSCNNWIVAKHVPNRRNRLRTIASNTGFVSVIAPLIEARISEVAV